MPCGNERELVVDARVHPPRRRPSEPIGQRLIDSTPPATTRSSWPDITFIAAMFHGLEARGAEAALRDARDALVPAGVEHGDARDGRHPVRPTGVTQPSTTSSTCEVFESVAVLQCPEEIAEQMDRR
jgi:hypothetical protein